MPISINDKLMRPVRQDVQGYPEIGLEVLGSPKTVRLEGVFRGETFSAPMEVWIMSLVAMLTPEQKQQFFTTLRQVETSGDYQRLARAQIVADIAMPPLDF